MSGFAVLTAYYLNYLRADASTTSRIVAPVFLLIREVLGLDTKVYTNVASELSVSVLISVC